MTNEILTNEILNDAELENISGGSRDDITNVNGISAKITSLYSKLGNQVSYNDYGARSYEIGVHSAPGSLR